MIFGLFRNKQGEAMHEEAIRTLNKVEELPIKDKKWVAKHLLEKIIQYVVIFLGILIVGFAYVWMKGDLDWVKMKLKYAAGRYAHLESKENS